MAVIQCSPRSRKGRLRKQAHGMASWPGAHDGEGPFPTRKGWLSALGSPALS